MSSQEKLQIDKEKRRFMRSINDRCKRKPQTKINQIMTSFEASTRETISKLHCI